MSRPFNFLGDLTQNIPERYKRPFRSLRPYALQLSLEAFRKRQDFSQVQTYCMFIGYGRSGHSLVGQLLNAHRHAVIVNEAHALLYLLHGYSRKQIYALLLQQDREFARRNRRWSGYDYRVPGLQQGRYDALKVIGDKQGGKSTNFLSQHPVLFDRLGTLFGNGRQRFRVIHHVRNPYDNISSISRRENKTLQKATRQYFQQATWSRSHLERIEAMSGAITIETHHEDLTAHPRKVLRRLVEFLGIQPYAEYLDACADKVHNTPHKSRHKVSWTPVLKEHVAEQARQFDFLREYRF